MDDGIVDTFVPVSATSGVHTGPRSTRRARVALDDGMPIALTVAVWPQGLALRNTREASRYVLSAEVAYALVLIQSGARNAKLVAGAGYADGNVLVCCSQPAGDVVIDL